MKKLILLAAAITFTALSLSASRAFVGNGYYRVQNYKTARYAYLMDDHAYVDYKATSVDLSAIELYKGDEKMQSDPATILYIERVDDVYDIQAQGTGVYAMIQEYVHLRDNGDGTYYAYGVYKGVSKYLGDPDNWTEEMSYMSDGTTGDYRKWYLQPISADQEVHFFGLKPTVTAGNELYCVSYCGFDYQLGQGMTAYYVKHVDAPRGVAVYAPIEGDLVAAGTAAFVKCPSASAAGNKVNIGVAGGKRPADNLLKGTYFSSHRYGHESYVAYDPATMRVLGTLADGSLGYVTDATLVDVPRNTSYLVVPAGAPAELRLVTPEEYDEIVANDSAKPQEIIWNDPYGDIIEGTEITLNAVATSGLEVQYEIIDGNELCQLNGNALKLLTPGKVTVKATQPGNEEWLAAEPVILTINVISGIADAAMGSITISGCTIHNPAALPLEVYNLQGMRVYTGSGSVTLAPGLYILRSLQRTLRAKLN